MEKVSDLRSVEAGCLNPREMVEVRFDGGSDVASEASADASQGGSCTRGYVARTIRRVWRGRLTR